LRAGRKKSGFAKSSPAYFWVLEHLEIRDGFLSWVFTHLIFFSFKKLLVNADGMPVGVFVLFWFNFNRMNNSRSTMKNQLLPVQK
jgi:hypothetical protein